MTDTNEAAGAAPELSDLLCAKRGLIQIAARLAMCGALNELEEVCENQQSISTRKLKQIVDRVSNKLKDEAVCIRNMANKINTQHHGANRLAYGESEGGMK